MFVARPFATVCGTIREYVVYTTWWFADPF